MSAAVDYLFSIVESHTGTVGNANQQRAANLLSLLN